MTIEQSGRCKKGKGYNTGSEWVIHPSLTQAVGMLTITIFKAMREKKKLTLTCALPKESRREGRRVTGGKRHITLKGSPSRALIRTRGREEKKSQLRPQLLHNAVKRGRRIFRRKKKKR